MHVIQFQSLCLIQNMKLALLLCGGCFSQSALLEHLSAEDPWEAFGDIIFMSMASWVCSVLSPPSPQPSTVGHLGTDAVGTCTKPHAESTPWEVWSAWILNLFTQIKLQEKKATPETKLAWKMLFIPLNSLQGTQ